MVVRLLVLLGAFVIVCPVMADVVVTTAELDELAEILEAYETYSKQASEALEKADEALKKADEALTTAQKQSEELSGQMINLETLFNDYVTATRAEARRQQVCQWVERGLFAAAIVAILIFK